MFIGINQKFTTLYLYIKPIINIILTTLIIILINLLVFSPIFLKEHKEYNILFYLHSTISVFNFVIYFITILIICIYILTKSTIWLQIIKINLLFGLIFSLFSLLTGISWGIFSWGNVIIFDNKVYILLLTFIVYLYIYLSIKNNSLKISYFMLFLILSSIPFWKLVSFWWNSYHQSLTISIIGASLPNNLWIYFFILNYALIFIYIGANLIYIRDYLKSIKLFNTIYD